MKAAEVLAVCASLVAGAVVTRLVGLGDVVPPAAAGASREAIGVLPSDMSGFDNAWLIGCDSALCGGTNINTTCAPGGAIGVPVDLNAGTGGKYVYLCLSPFRYPSNGINSIRWVWTTGWPFASWWDHTFSGTGPWQTQELCSKWLGGAASEYKGGDGVDAVDANEAAPGKYIWLCPRLAQAGTDTGQNIKAVRVTADPDWRIAVTSCMAETSQGVSKATTGDHNQIMDLNMGNSGNWVFACVAGIKRCPPGNMYEYGGDVGGFCCSEQPTAQATCPGSVCALDPSRAQGNTICP